MPEEPRPSFLTLLRLRFFIILILFLGALLFLFAFYTIRKSKSNMLEVMEKEGKALLESLVLASQNTVKANALIEEVVIERLSDVNTLVDEWEASHKLSPSKLSEITSESNLFKIDILDSRGKILKSSNVTDYSFYRDSSGASLPEFRDVIQGKRSNTIIEIKNPEKSWEEKFGLVTRRGIGKGAVASFIPTGLIDYFQKEIGIGYLIQQISQQQGIEYIVLQSPEGIVLASKKVEKLLKLENDEFLMQVLSTQETRSRLTNFENKEVLEIVKGFVSEPYPPGVFRVGLSLDDYKELSQSYQRQTIILTLIGLMLGVLLLGLVFVNQSYSVLQKSYSRIKSLTGNILEGMESAVVAIDSAGKIILINKVAEGIFGLTKEKAQNQSYESFFSRDECFLKETLTKGRLSKKTETILKNYSGENRNLIVATSTFQNERNEIQGAVAVIQDITELKKLEEERKKSERLSALGDLAAGVAHEIRNPLNAIYIGAQRLETEFSPKLDKKDYREIVKTIITESQRLEKIVKDFLGLARAQKLNLKKVKLNQFLGEIINVAELEAGAKKLELVKKIKSLPEAMIDEAELKKAFLNIVLNAVQATNSGGRIGFETCFVEKENKALIKISDTGPGIASQDLHKIFQPYFTTKKEGTGLGLAITHRVISDHKGTIEVESELGKGTTFIIKLPLS